MAQIFDRSSNALARASLILTGLIVIALGVTLDQLQRSPWVTRQGQRADQPVPVQPQAPRSGSGPAVPVLSYLGGEVELCRHSRDQDLYELPFTDLDQRQPVASSAQFLGDRQLHSWTKVHDLPDFAYFNHSIHVNKGIGCSTCHGRVDQMPLMYAQNTLQMEWCLNCHRNAGEEPAADD